MLHYICRDFETSSLLMICFGLVSSYLDFSVASLLLFVQYKRGEEELMMIATIHLAFAKCDVVRLTFKNNIILNFVNEWPYYLYSK